MKKTKILIFVSILAVVLFLGVQVASAALPPNPRDCESVKMTFENGDTVSYCWYSTPN